MELERVTRRPHQLVARELRRLAAAGLLRARILHGRRQYEPDPEGPVARDIARLVRQTRGRVPRIRHALVTLRSPTVAWIISGSPDPTIVAGAGRRPRLRLIVLTGAPRSLVRVQLANVTDRETEIHSMSVREWVARLDKGDVLLRHARRARKVWVLGGWEVLVAREQAQLEAKQRLRAAAANWREELSDEWDEDWDPFAPAPGAA